jgi:DNA processing protein
MAACDECLGRSALLGRLAPHIEKVATGEPGSRCAELLALAPPELVRAVAGRKGPGLLEPPPDPDALRRELEALGCWSTCRHDALYPESLNDLGAEAPHALLCRGNRDTLEALEIDAAVTVVGARRASGYGSGVAEDLARLLAGAGLTVVSGLAYGIDSAAHRGALAGNGATVAVLGSGPDRAYPRARAVLYRQVVERGLVISELPPGTSPFRWTFPARNRIMAALAGMTVVVEAAERSGSLITAAMAQQLGRDLGAVPGPVNAWLSAGTNQLLSEGAAVIRGAQDVLDAVLGAGRSTVELSGPTLESELARVLALVEQGHASCDSVAVALETTPGQAATALARLELLGYAASDAAGRYMRTGLGVPHP